MAVDARGISKGAVFNYFVDLAKKQHLSELYTTNQSERKFLPLDMVKSTLEQLDLSFAQLIAMAQPNASLNEKEAEILSVLNGMPDSLLRNVRRFTRRLQHPWWDNLEKRSVKKQLFMAACVRTGNLKQWDSQKNPTLASLPKKSVHFVDTDSLWSLCTELDVPICAFSRFGKDFPYYSKNPMADMAFCEYKFLDISLRPIVESFIFNAAPSFETEVI